MIIIVILCMVLLSGRAFTKQQTAGGKEKLKTESSAAPVQADETKIALELLGVSKFDLATGKYNAEVGVYVQYSQLDLPSELEVEVFENEILPKVKKEDRKQLEKYYEYDEKTYTYVLKEGLSDEESLVPYGIIKSTGYYENNLPFEFTNGKIEKDDKKDKVKVERIEDPNDPTYVYYKVNVEVTSKIDFKYFPFDSQDLSIKLASPYILSTVVYRPLDEVTLLPDQIEYASFQQQIHRKLDQNGRAVVLNAYQPNNEKTFYELKENASKDDEKKVKAALNSIGFNSLIDPGIKIPGWVIKEGEPKYGVDSYMKEKFSTFTFPITISRNPLASFMKVLVPLLILMLASFATLLIGISVVGNRYAVTAGMLLACAMLHLNATSSIPQTGYLTLADKIFIFSYLSIFINLAASVLMVYFNERKNEKVIKVVYSGALIIVPTITALLYMLVLLRVI